MESASCERASYVSNFQKDTSGFTVIQGPAARIRPSRLPQDYISCEFLFKNTRIPLFPDLYHYPVPLCRRLACLTWYCVSLFSWLWGPGEELVGMRNIPDRTLVFIRRMKVYLLAWKVKQSHSLSLLCVDSPCLCPFWSAGPLTSQWGRTSKKTFPKECTSLITSA